MRGGGREGPNPNPKLVTSLVRREGGVNPNPKLVTSLEEGVEEGNYLPKPNLPPPSFFFLSQFFVFSLFFHFIFLIYFVLFQFLFNLFFILIFFVHFSCFFMFFQFFRCFFFSFFTFFHFLIFFCDFFFSLAILAQGHFLFKTPLVFQRSVPGAVTVFSRRFVMGRNRKFVLEDDLQQAVWRTILRGPRPPSAKWAGTRNIVSAVSKPNQPKKQEPQKKPPPKVPSGKLPAARKEAVSPDEAVAAARQRVAKLQAVLTALGGKRTKRIRLCWQR